MRRMNLGTHCEAPAGFSPSIFLPEPSECWDWTPACLVCYIILHIACMYDSVDESCVLTLAVRVFAAHSYVLGERNKFNMLSR